MVKSFLDRNFLMSVAFLLMLSLGLTSCDTLKKKFTRQKKGGTETVDFQPVLEPEEYVAPDKNVSEMYKQHYAVIKVWYKDLWTGIEQKAPDNMVKYSLKQILDHIDQMKQLLRPEKAAELDKLAALLTSYNRSFDQPREMRNYSAIQSDLRAFDRMLRDHFRFDEIQGDLVHQ